MPGSSKRAVNNTLGLNIEPRGLNMRDMATKGDAVHRTRILVLRGNDIGSLEHRIDGGRAAAFA